MNKNNKNHQSNQRAKLFFRLGYVTFGEVSKTPEGMQLSCDYICLKFKL